MSGGINEGAVVTFTANGAIAAKARVKLTAGSATIPAQVETAGAGEQHIGIAEYAAATTTPVSVRLRGRVMEGIASEAVEVGDPLYGAASGKIKDTSDGTCIGHAIEIATANNDIVKYVDFTVDSTTAATVSIADAGNYTATATVEAALQELYLQQVSALKRINIPLTSFLDVAGTQLTTFVNGASDQPGFELTGSEMLNIRWNNHAAPLAVMCSAQVPNDADITADMTMKFLCCKTGATVGDAVTWTVTAFNNVSGALYDADANFGGVSSAMTGDAISKTLQTETLTLALADLGAVGTNMTFTIKPTGGTLGTDDVHLCAVWIEYKGKVVAS